MRAEVVSRNGVMVREHVVKAFEEVTYASWVLEGGRGPSSLTWRDTALALGIVDPMQTALPPGHGTRRILGERLRMGERLTR